MLYSVAQQRSSFNPHSTIMDPKTGILLINLGTPDAPTEEAVRTYLAQFLSDPYVIDYPRWLWKPILNNFILKSRPQKSAHAYARIWEESGSPLLVITRSIASKLSQKNPEWEISTGMRYGQPSVPRALDELTKNQVTRLVIFPLFPQYSTTTSETAIQHALKHTQTGSPVQEIIEIRDYHDHPAYISALVDSIKQAWSKAGKPEKTLFSYHGVPKRYVTMKGEPYRKQCIATSQLAARKAGMDTDDYLISFQSQFGPEPWLQPYTEDTLAELGAAGCRNLHVICPGFAADCLETLEEIALEGKRIFREAGGGKYHYIRALNDREQHIQALTEIIAAAL